MPKSYVGLDLGSAHVDCAILSQKGKVVQLSDYFTVKKEVAGEDKVSDQARVSHEFEQRKMHNAKAAISISDRNFILINFKLPKLPQKEKDIAIRSEIEQKLPFPLEECAFDILRLNPKESAENDYVAFCTRMSDINRNHAVASSFHLLPDKVLTEMIASLNCAIYNEYLTNTDISYLLLDVGGLHVGFTLVTNNLPWLTFSLSAKDSFMAAENMPGQEIDPRHFFEDKLTEIAKVVSSFEERSVIKPVRKILMFGKQHITEFAREKLATVTPLNIEVVDPIKKITLSAALKTQNIEAFISPVAVGLALSSIEKLEVNSVKG